MLYWVLNKKQVANEEDFLNHSSLADIHKGVGTEGSNANDHLKELHGRNTLGLPHLQSSYPLVTSSEEETDSDDSSERFIKKRKMFEDDNFSNASKKIFRPSSVSIQKNISSKSPTSIKKGTFLLKKGSTRTPSSIRHFVGMRPKNVKK
ncbi:hypothetical protein TNCT_262311 [Trichonephila clavata]|uniref:Uncharacterized protein n=1 Tax=Trichonephila clavata TaxID=2740835 RepID=A0A8X6H9X3_TRICU|nr:hypothetical protein TNCT_262311 [Trichonephila clavata]